MLQKTKLAVVLFFLCSPFAQNPAFGSETIPILSAKDLRHALSAQQIQALKDAMRREIVPVEGEKSPKVKDWDSAFNTDEPFAGMVELGFLPDEEEAEGAQKVQIFSDYHGLGRAEPSAPEEASEERSTSAEGEASPMMNFSSSINLACYLPLSGVAH